MSAIQTSTTHDPSISAVLEKLYAVISFEEGGEPDWPGLQEVFSEHARITRVTPEGTDYLDRASFLEMTHSMLDHGAYTSFYEVETARTVATFGNVAQVWSHYETRRSRAADEALGRGINSIQLIHDGSSWRVLGLLWDETQTDTRGNHG